MQSHLVEMIDERKFSDKDEKRDLSSSTNENEKFLNDRGQRLGEVKLVGGGIGLGLPARSFLRLWFREVFVFYMTGHEVKMV